MSMKIMKNKRVLLKALIILALSALTATAFAEYYVVYAGGPPVVCLSGCPYYHRHRIAYHHKYYHPVFHRRISPYRTVFYDICPCTCDTVWVSRPCGCCGRRAAPVYWGPGVQMIEVRSYYYYPSPDEDMRTGDDTGNELDIDR